MVWLGVVIFVVALLISVGLHELGHLATAKAFGMKATRYFIGMGPTIWSTTRGETEYGIKALPVGGFVKIIGMTSMDEVDPEDEPRAFRRASAWHRIIVLAAGSFMHFLLASVLFFGLALLLGVENDNTTQVGTVSLCVPVNAHAASIASCRPGKDPKAPSVLAGIRPGDTITAFDGRPVSTYDQLTSSIKKVEPGTTVPVTVQRDGRQLTLHATLASVEGRPGGFLGISSAQVFDRASLPGAVKFVGTGWSQTVVGEVKSIGALPTEFSKLFDKRTASSGQGVTSMVGVAEVTGQVVAQPVAWQSKVSFVVMIMASINIFVGIFNLLPILPMDGGHILAVVLERIRAAYARLRRRPDPGLFDLQKLIPVSFSIFAVIIAFSALVLISNIIYPVNIG